MDPANAGHQQLLPGGHFISNSRHWPRGFHEGTDLSEGPMTDGVAGCKPLLSGSLHNLREYGTVCCDTSPLRGN